MPRLWFVGRFQSPSPDVVLCRAEKTKFKKYSEWVRSRLDIRFTLFAVTEFGALGGHATAFLNELARHATASEGIHVGKLLGSWRRHASFALYVADADNVLRRLSAAADDEEVASSSAWMPFQATSFFTRAIGRKRLCASSCSA
jgi:hypothetical protein